LEQRGARLEPTAATRRLSTQAMNERLRMERDILKKSIAIFAGTRT